MKPNLVERLLAVNHEFYERYAGSFSSSRYSIQPGVRHLLPELIQAQNLLDVGCGNGNLALALQKNNFTGHYLGIDFSPNLLNRVPTTPDRARSGERHDHFITLELSDPSWPTHLDLQTFNAITCFAVLHHLPGRELQRQTFQHFAALLQPAGKLYLSVWQPLNSPRLRKRLIPWQTLDIDTAQLDPETDLLLDWRAEDQTDSPAIRYVHQFTAPELDELAQNAALTKQDEWYSDGHDGNLALYQTWQRPEDENHD